MVEAASKASNRGTAETLPVRHQLLSDLRRKRPMENDTQGRYPKENDTQDGWLG